MFITTELYLIGSKRIVNHQIFIQQFRVYSYVLTDKHLKLHTENTLAEDQ